MFRKFRKLIIIALLATVAAAALAAKLHWRGAERSLGDEAAADRISSGVASADGSGGPGQAGGAATTSANDSRPATSQFPSSSDHLSPGAAKIAPASGPAEGEAHQPAGADPTARDPGSTVVGDQGGAAGRGRRSDANRDRSADSAPGSDAEARSLYSQRVPRLRDEARYRLPSTSMVQRLEKAVDPALRLAESQRRQVEAINQAMKSRIDAALQEIWAARQEVEAGLAKAAGEAGGASGTGGTGESGESRLDDIKALRHRYADLLRQESAARRPLNDEYKNSLRNVLTTEQMATLDGPLTPDQSRKLYGSAGPAQP